jgi:hypothetical protein
MEYKLANNKRLCVELMLLKMCNVMNKLAPKVATAEKKTL